VSLICNLIKVDHMVKTTILFQNIYLHLLNETWSYLYKLKLLYISNITLMIFRCGQTLCVTL